MKAIKFNTEMVHTVLDGGKTQTRRPLKEILGMRNVKDFKASDLEKYPWTFRQGSFGSWNDLTHEQLIEKCPWGKVGDRLWVQETFFPIQDAGYGNLYRADMPMHWDDSEMGGPVTLNAEDYKWKPSSQMTKEQSRITLEITDIRVERLQDITGADIVAEGVKPRIYDEMDGLRLNTWINLWDSIYKPKGFGWDTNCFVWVLEFKVLTDKEA